MPCFQTIGATRYARTGLAGNLSGAPVAIRGPVFDTSFFMNNVKAQDAVQGGLTEGEKRDNVIRLAFKGDQQLLDAFLKEIDVVAPFGTTVVLRGSAVTGFRWNDHAPFDADGVGTSDLDLTLVGANALSFFTPTGFFVPGVHSRPLSDEDPDIAPALIPLRRRLMDMVRRPVNIQASREIVLQFRGDLLDQPYLVLFQKPDHPTLHETPG